MGFVNPPHLLSLNFTVVEEVVFLKFFVQEYELEVKIYSHMRAWNYWHVRVLKRINFLAQTKVYLFWEKREGSACASFGSRCLQVYLPNEFVKVCVHVYEVPPVFL